MRIFEARVFEPVRHIGESHRSSSRAAQRQRSNGLRAASRHARETLSALKAALSVSTPDMFDRQSEAEILEVRIFESRIFQSRIFEVHRFDFRIGALRSAFGEAVNGVAYGDSESNASHRSQNGSSDERMRYSTHVHSRKCGKSLRQRSISSYRYAS